MLKTQTIKAIIISIVLIGSTLTSHQTLAVERYIGEIILVGYNFCPRGTTPADGKMLPINQNTALFSLYGTTYGGNGRTTFALPDLQGRSVISQGNFTKKNNHRLGERGFIAPGGRNAELNNLTKGTLALQYCVVMQGIYPSRN